MYISKQSLYILLQNHKLYSYLVNRIVLLDNKNTETQYFFLNLQKNWNHLEISV